ncbi:MAG: TRAP transporter small permease [Bacteroidales bacterium]
MKIRNTLDRLLESTLVLLMSALVLDVLWQVVSRYLLSSPSSFTDELAGYLLIWVGVLGAAYVAGKQEHLAIDILLQRSSPRRQRILRILIHSFIFLFAASTMVLGGIVLVYSRFALDVRSAALQLPLGYVYMILPLSGLLILYYETVHLLEIRNEMRSTTDTETPA